MNIIVTTNSGSIYKLSKMGGKFYIVKVGKWAGEVIATPKDAICVGKSMEMLIRKKGVYFKNAELIEPLSTTPVKEISVKL